MRFNKKKIIHLLHHIAHGFAHLEHPFHLTYFGLVFTEGHSLYAYAAGGCFVIVGTQYVVHLFTFLGED